MVDHVHQQRDDGQGLIEYALILVFVAIAVVGVLTLFGPPLNAVYEEVLRFLQL
jgi:pilus assembly protein Flp/PilA